MLTLAFEMTPLYFSLLVLLLTALSAGLCVFFHAKGYTQAEKVTHAAFAGLRQGIKDASLGQDEITALEDAIRAASEDYGKKAEAKIDDHLDEGLALPSALPGAPNTTTGPVTK